MEEGKMSLMSHERPGKECGYCGATGSVYSTGTTENGEGYGCTNCNNLWAEYD